MKAIILTYAPVSAEEKEVLTKTKIYKLALNNHGAEFIPDARIVTDYILEKLYNKFPETIISVRDKLKTHSDRVIYFDQEFKGATIISGIDYLISKNYDEILITGNNKVNNIKFQNIVNENIDKLSKKVKLYQYSKGNFNLPVKSILEFCS